MLALITHVLYTYTQIYIETLNFRDGIMSTELKGLAKAFNTILSRSEETQVPSKAVQEAEERKKVELKLRKQIRELRRSRKQIDGHKKVDILKKEFEKSLRRIATRGVVALFNAVRDAKSEAATTGASVDQMPIDSFMALLSTHNKQ